MREAPLPVSPFGDTEGRRTIATVEVDQDTLDTLLALTKDLVENLRGLSKAHAAVEKRVTNCEHAIGEVKMWAPTPEG